MSATTVPSEAIIGSLKDASDRYNERATQFSIDCCAAFGHWGYRIGFAAPRAMIQLYTQFSERQLMFVRVKRPPEFWLAGMAASSYYHFLHHCFTLICRSIEADWGEAKDTSSGEKQAEMMGEVEEIRRQLSMYLPADYELPWAI